MCDTLVAVGSATADGSVIFAKNSDREPNEAHELLLIPRASHPIGSMVQCTYVEIPQVAETYAVLLAKPFWIWGCEMGSNEFGVTIGNEAVFTKVPYEKRPGLIGMDFMRLALERSQTAAEALTIITTLLAEYGQGGNCAITHEFYYHNSFLIADPQEAWVLETAGREWAAEKVKTVRSISNRLTIGREWDLASDNLVAYAVERGWCKGAADFDFGRCYSDLIFTKFSDSYSRFCRTREALTDAAGKITVASMMNYLRDHGDVDASWSPAAGLQGATVCMHASFGPIRQSQTTGSMVSHLTPAQQTHWVTGSAAPCLSLFKPVWIDAGLPDMGARPTATYDEAALWWRHEALHRHILRDYAAYAPLIQLERDTAEAKFL
ncbi:MAG: C69 family dipeptidase, partial [Anaerolineales bacterium]|nr:C69 family dipeptidase [Anaerolineales bacterium]